MNSSISSSPDVPDSPPRRQAARTAATSKRFSVAAASSSSAAAPLHYPSGHAAAIDAQEIGVRQRKPLPKIGTQRQGFDNTARASSSATARPGQAIPPSARRQVSASLLSSSGRESWRYQTLPPGSGTGRLPPTKGVESDLGLSAWAALAELRAGPLSPRLAYSPTTQPAAAECPGQESHFGQAVGSSIASDAGDSSFGLLLSSTLRGKQLHGHDSVTSSSASSIGGAGPKSSSGVIDIGGGNPTLSREATNFHQVVASPGSTLDGIGHLASSTSNESSGSIPHTQLDDFSRGSISQSFREGEYEEASAGSRAVHLTQSPSAIERPLEGLDELRRSRNLNRSFWDDQPKEDPIPPPPASSAPISAQTLPAQGPPTKAPLKRWRRPLLGFTRQQVDVLKCSLAYTLASLFTFVPFLNSFLLGTSSAHTIATVSVYYAPAKSLGMMIEADVYCLVVATIAAVVSLAAVGTLKAADNVGTSWGRDCGDWTALFFWFGGSLSVLAWLKVRLGKQSFNSATSMGLVIMSNVIVKEGGLRKLLEVLLNVVLGTSISNLVCFTIFPHSATAKLQSDINSTLTSFSTLLTILSQTFLLDAPSPSSSPAQDLASAVTAHEKSFNGLKKTLSEAKSEFLGDAGERFEVVVNSLTRLAQHLTGLRSGTGLQYELMAAAKEGRIIIDQSQPDDPSKVAWSPGERKEGSGFFNAGIPAETKTREDSEDERLAAEANIFGEVREHVGPQLRNVTAACNATLLAIRSTFDAPNTGTGEPLEDFTHLMQELQSALVDFQVASNDSIADIYGGGANADNHAGHVQSPKETVFLVFYFIFTFDEFAREVLFLLEQMEATLFDRPRETTWQRMWRQLRRAPRLRSASGPRPRRTLRKRMSTIIPIDPSEFLKPAVFPPKSVLAPNTATNPLGSMLSFKPRLYHFIWEVLERCRKNDIKYALKVGMATALLAAPAFSDTWRTTFLEFRMEWGLIAFFATMSPVEGATNAASVFRLLGTFAGAAIAAVVYSVFPEDNIALPLIGFLFSLPCFWVIVTMPFYAAAGRFVLLTYNLTALYCYNSRAIDTPVLEIAYRRFVSVSIGVVYTLIVSRIIWPYAARRELLSGLSDFYVDLSFLYTRLLATFSSCERVPPMRPASDPNAPSWDEEQTALSGGYRSSAAADPLSASVREFMAMELHLQLSILQLKDLLEAATREPRLKGPFPKALFNSCIMSSQTILDRFHSIRCVVNRDEWDQSLYRSHVAPVNAERREMVGNVLLYFSTISAGFRLKTPMPPYLPPAERARQRLLCKAEALSLVHVPGKGSKHLLFFSYVLAMAGIIRELEYIGSVLQSAYGVIGGGVDEFEDLFFNPLIGELSDGEDGEDSLG